MQTNVIYKFRLRWTNVRCMIVCTLQKSVTMIRHCCVREHGIRQLSARDAPWWRQVQLVGCRFVIACEEPSDNQFCERDRSLLFKKEVHLGDLVPWWNNCEVFRLKQNSIIEESKRKISKLIHLNFVNAFINWRWSLFSCFCCRFPWASRLWHCKVSVRRVLNCCLHLVH